MRYKTTDAPRYFHIQHKPPTREIQCKPVKAYLKVLICVLLSALVYIPIIVSARPVRVGDGSEYYAMAVSWTETHRPYMTAPAWVYYDQLYRSNAIPGISSGEELKNFSPLLVRGDSQDFNHFWFYSLGAAVLVEIGDYSGVTIPVHTGFMLLHFLLLAGLLYTCWQYFGWHGLVGAIVLTGLSPALWYVDKVHTEFFTYCLTSIAVVFFIKKQFSASALFLALAGTQNLSFAVISLAVLGYGIGRPLKTKVKLTDALLSAGTLIVITLHPLYYLIRFGVVDPQFLAEAAAIGTNLPRFYIWFLDPDLGLLPNWPLSILLAVFAMWWFVKNWKQTRIREYLFFCLVFVSVSLLAKSSTINLNSGASPGLARYATWYIALFFPAILALIYAAEKTDLRLSLLILLFVLAGFFSARNYWPWTTNTAHCHPSAASYWVQKNLPWLYDPPPEVFAERYGGVCEIITARKNTAVIGPDCRKVLILNPTAQPEYTITGAAGCGYDFTRLSGVIESRFVGGELKSGTPYQHLTAQDVSTHRIDPIPGEWYSFGYGQSLSAGVVINPGGWSVLDETGVWTVGSTSTLQIPCPVSSAMPTAIELEVEPFLADTHTFVSTSLEINRQQVWAGILEKNRLIHFDLSAGACQPGYMMTMRISIDNPISRARLGISGDLSKLGIKLVRVRYLPAIE